MKLDCDIVQELYPLYVENELSPKLNKQINEHLDSCDECRLIFKDEAGFHDIVQMDNEIIQPSRSLDDKLKKNLKRQRYNQYTKSGLIFLFSIVAIYFLFFRFTFIIGSTNLTTPSFEQDYGRIQEKLNISENAKITHMSLRFNSAGQMEDFRTRIVDFSETHLDIYDMTFSPRIDGFHMYRVKHSRISDPDFISKSQAELLAEKVFSILNKVDYDSILADVGANRYWVGTDDRLKNIKVRYDVRPLRQFYMIENDRIEKLEEGQTFNNVFGLNLFVDTTNEGPVRVYLFH